MQALAAQAAAMEAELAAGAAALGHSNHQQKLQYTRGLKQELEGIRAECNALLRERFGLEQCIRCWASLVALALGLRLPLAVLEGALGPEAVLLFELPG